MKTGIYSHKSCLKHDPEPASGFAPARLKAAIDALRAAGFAGLDWQQGPPITRDILRLAHTDKHIDTVLRPLEPGQQIAFDADTFAMSGTAEAALQAAGLVMQAARDVVSGTTDQAFCIVSPGGHHAEAEAVIGFCFFNHVAMAAVAAQELLGMKRVAVVDIDAHHGNGTQSLFWNHADRLCISLHQDNQLSGFVHETGAWGNILNIPLAAGSDGLIIHAAVDHQVLPKLQQFKPDLLLISTGFDMHKDDPLAQLNLATEDYFRLGQKLAGACTRVVAVMEGGYNLNVLGDSVAHFVKGMTSHDQ